jgi:hypothetical protein
MPKKNRVTAGDDGGEIADTVKGKNTPTEHIAMQLSVIWVL